TSHEPCTFIGDLEHPVKLMSGDALLAGTKQVIGKQPLIERDMAVLKDRPNCNGELLPAPAALPHTLANVLILLGRFRLKAIGIVKETTMRANGTIRPSEFFQKLTRLVFIAKVLSKRD